MYFRSSGNTEGHILLYRQYMLFVREKGEPIETVCQLLGDALGLFINLCHVTEIHKRYVMPIYGVSVSRDMSIYGV